MSQTQGWTRSPGAAAARTTALACRHALAGFGLALLLPMAASAQQKKAALPPAAPASVPTIEAPAPPAVENSYLDGPLL